MNSNNKPFRALAVLVMTTVSASSAAQVTAPAEGPPEAAAQENAPPTPTSMDRLRWSGRFSLFTGRYDVDAERTTSNGFDPTIRSNFETDTGMLGAGLVGTVQFASLYAADAVIEYTDIDTFSITEAQLRLTRVRILGPISAFAGLRVATQGDGFGNDDIYREAGYLVGLGAAAPMPFVNPSMGLQLSGGLTYNGSELDLPSGGSPKADGLVVSLRMQTRLPWSVSLRYRRFAFDNSTPLARGSVVEDLTEQYLTLAVEYSLRRRR